MVAVDACSAAKSAEKKDGLAHQAESISLASSQVKAVMLQPQTAPCMTPLAFGPAIVSAARLQICLHLAQLRNAVNVVVQDACLAALCTVSQHSTWQNEHDDLMLPPGTR